MFKLPKSAQEDIAISAGFTERQLGLTKVVTPKQIRELAAKPISLDLRPTLILK